MLAALSPLKEDGHFDVGLREEKSSWLGPVYRLTMPCIFQKNAFSARLSVTPGGYVEMNEDFPLSLDSFRDLSAKAPYYRIEPTGEAQEGDSLAAVSGSHYRRVLRDAGARRVRAERCWYALHIGGRERCRRRGVQQRLDLYDRRLPAQSFMVGDIRSPRLCCKPLVRRHHQLGPVGSRDDRAATTGHSIVYLLTGTRSSAQQASDLGRTVARRCRSRSLERCHAVYDMGMYFLRLECSECARLSFAGRCRFALERRVCIRASTRMVHARTGAFLVRPAERISGWLPPRAAAFRHRGTVERGDVDFDPDPALGRHRAILEVDEAGRSMTGPGSTTQR